MPKTISEITKDLKEVRDYYKHQTAIMRACRYGGSTPDILQKVKDYGDAAAHLPTKHYIIYVNYVVAAKTVEECAAISGYSKEHTRHLFQECKKHLQEYFENHKEISE